MQNYLLFTNSIQIQKQHLDFKTITHAWWQRLDVVHGTCQNRAKKRQKFPMHSA